MSILATALTGQGFDALANERPNILTFASTASYETYAAQEFLRFLSVGGTLRDNFNDIPASYDERMLTHVPLRSLLEGFFWILYIYEHQSPVDRAKRFEEQLLEFQRQYFKLYSDIDPNHQAAIPAPQAGWNSNPRARDVASVLLAQRNAWGDKMDYLYFTYRVTSFDTHGRIAPVLFAQSFGPGAAQFPYLKLGLITDLVANAYLNVWNDIK